MLGIIGAMDEEVAQIVGAMQVGEVYRKACMEFHKGRLGACDAVVVRSGIGKVNAAVCTQILCDRFGVDAGSIRGLQARSGRKSISAMWC